MLNHLISQYSDMNIKLLSILKSFDLGLHELTNSLINEYVVNGDVIFERKMALVFQAIEDIGYNPSLDSLIENIIDEYDNNSIDLSIENKYKLLGVLYQIDNIDGTIKLGKNLLLSHFDSDLNNVDLQKYIGEILLEVMGPDPFIQFCKETFVTSKIEGLLYVLVNTYIANEEYVLAEKELDLWLQEYPNNQRIINKKNRILEYIPFE